MLPVKKVLLKWIYLEMISTITITIFGKIEKEHSCNSEITPIE